MFVNAGHVVLFNALMLVVGIGENDAIFVPVDFLDWIAANLAFERELLVHELERFPHVKFNNWRN